MYLASRAQLLLCSCATFLEVHRVFLKQWRHSKCLDEDVCSMAGNFMHKTESTRALALRRLPTLNFRPRSSFRR